MTSTARPTLNTQLSSNSQTRSTQTKSFGACTMDFVTEIVNQWFAEYNMEQVKSAVCICWLHSVANNS